MDGKLRALQLSELELLDELVRVCERHGLRYYLVGGTLLGAVRHKGFIPWDDDIDVAMPRADYEKLLEVRGELPGHLLLLSEELDKDCPFHYGKLYYKAKPLDPEPAMGPKWLYLDIFQLFPSRQPRRMARLAMDMLTVMGYVMQVKRGWEAYIPYKKRSARIGFRVLKCLPYGALRRLRKSITAWLTREDTEWWFCPGGKYGGAKEFFPQAWFDPAVSLQFEDRAYSAPANWDAYLKNHYGDYMTPPPEAERTDQDKS